MIDQIKASQPSLAGEVMSEIDISPASLNGRFKSYSDRQISYAEGLDPLEEVGYFENSDDEFSIEIGDRTRLVLGSVSRSLLIGDQFVEIGGIMQPDKTDYALTLKLAKAALYDESYNHRWMGAVVALDYIRTNMSLLPNSVFGRVGIRLEKFRKSELEDLSSPENAENELHKEAKRLVDLIPGYSVEYLNVLRLPLIIKGYDNEKYLALRSDILDVIGDERVFKREEMVVLYDALILLLYHSSGPVGHINREKIRVWGKGLKVPYRLKDETWEATMRKAIDLYLIIDFLYGDPNSPPPLNILNQKDEAEQAAI